jgi:hypothetical protein
VCRFSVIMNFSAAAGFRRVALWLTLSGLALPGGMKCEAATFTTFDVPGAIGTYPQSINNRGSITGYYYDSLGIRHGFLRTPDGSIISFDAPDAVTVYGEISFSGGTIPVSINDQESIRVAIAPFSAFHDSTTNLAGQLVPSCITVTCGQGAITGYYPDSSGRAHGFLRTPNGGFATIDVPSARGVEATATYPLSINNLGAITGHYLGSLEGLSGDAFGFVRARDGSFLPFAAFSGGQETSGVSINASGAIAGIYVVLDGDVSIARGFLRASDGSITRFGAVPGTLQTLVDTYPRSINASKAITGSYLTKPSPFSQANTGGTIAGSFASSSGSSWHGFLRTPDGHITTFDVRGAVGVGVVCPPESPSGTNPVSINASGMITGYYVDSSGFVHGFLRAPDGSIAGFDAPGAAPLSCPSANTIGPGVLNGPGGGTNPVGINVRGTITGSYFDSSGVAHGFVRNP